MLEDRIKVSKKALSASTSVTCKVATSHSNLRRGDSNLSKASTLCPSICPQKTNKPDQDNLSVEKLIFSIKRVDRKTGKCKNITKHFKMITNCKHTSGKYYAKGMCRNCYHNKGQKSKKAFKCPHSIKSHYARGLCKNCYLYSYHQKRRGNYTKEEDSPLKGSSSQPEN